MFSFYYNDISYAYVFQKAWFLARCLWVYHNVFIFVIPMRVFVATKQKTQNPFKILRTQFLVLKY